MAISWFRVTAVPLSVRLPAPGSCVILTVTNASPMSASLKPKSLATRVRLASSPMVMVLSAALGASFTDVLTTVVVALLAVPPAPSSRAMVKVVVSVPPGALRLAAGWKTSWRMAACAADAVPEKP